MIASTTFALEWPWRRCDCFQGTQGKLPTQPLATPVPSDPMPSSVYEDTRHVNGAHTYLQATESKYNLFLKS